MTHTVLVQCTKTKRDEAAPACDLYDESALFRKMRAYAQVATNEWYILSAKHGLLHPDETIEPYDDFGIGEDDAETIATRLSALGVTEAELLAGRKYADPLTPELERRGVDVIEPLRGLQIGNRLSKLDAMTAREANESVC